jgi:hypothetical protein
MAFALCGSGAFAQTAREIRGPAGVVPLASEEPPAKIIIDPPVAEPLAHGGSLSSTEPKNLRIVPVFGPNASMCRRGIGHIHVAVDDAPWHWAGASGEPLIMNGLPAAPQGPYRARQREHQTLDRGVLNFVIP